MHDNVVQPVRKNLLGRALEEAARVLVKKPEAKVKWNNRNR